MPSSVIHSSKEIWGADAQEWNPERWMSGDTKDLEKNWLVVSHTRHWTPNYELRVIVLSWIYDVSRTSLCANANLEDSSFHGSGLRYSSG